MEREYWFVSAAGILSAFIIFGAGFFAEMGLSLYQIALFHSIFIFLFLPVIILKKEYRIKREMLKLFILFGLLDAFLSLAEFAPVVLGVPVAITVLLLYTQPIWTTILERLFLKEKITRLKVLAVIMVIIGAAILINPFAVETAGNLVGIVIALVAGVLLSIWLIFGRVAGIRKYNPVTTNFGYYFFMLIFLLLLYPIVSMLITDPTIVSLSLNIRPDIWLYLGLFAMFALFTSHILYFQGVKKVSASTAGVILMLEPVIGAILATIFLQQLLTWNIVLGGALILLANYLVIRE